MTDQTSHSGRIEELHAPKTDAVKAVEAAVRSGQACRFDERMWDGWEPCQVHSEKMLDCHRADICDLGLAALRRQLEERDKRIVELEARIQRSGGGFSP